MKSYFELDKYKTTVQTEIIAGISSFLAMSYIIVVNPRILSQAGMPFAAVLTATVLVSSLCSILMGLYARNPVMVAPGMGLNAFFTFSVVLGMKVPWQEALGAVFWSGLVFIVLSVFNIRTYIVQAIPKPLRFAIAAGIGLFITLIGFANAKFIVANPSTLVGIGPVTPDMAVFLLGLFFTGILLIKRVKGGILLGILVTTAAAYLVHLVLPGQATAHTNTIGSWSDLFAAPDFSLFGSLDLIKSLRWAVIPVVFAFVFTDMFDSLSTLVGLAEAADLLDENGEPRNIRRALVTDGFATLLAGLLGSSPGTVYVESAVGIEEGGRSGLTAVVGGLLFLPFLFLAPLLALVPPIATAPALVLVGVFMVRPVVKIDWFSLDEAIPAFLAMIVIPFSYSITEGIIWGFLSWTIVKLATGKASEIGPALLIIDVFAVLELLLRK